MDDLLYKTGLGSGITAIGLLAILIQNFLVRKKDEHNFQERFESLSGKIYEIDKRQIEEIKFFYEAMNNLQLKLQQIQSEHHLHTQVYAQFYNVTAKNLDKIEEKIDKLAS